MVYSHCATSFLVGFGVLPKAPPRGSLRAWGCLLMWYHDLSDLEVARRYSRITKCDSWKALAIVKQMRRGNAMAAESIVRALGKVG